jgi:hypothetical protein
VLVDTSVWSTALRAGSPRDHAGTVRLRQLLDKAQVVLTGLILQEILQGFRAEAAFRRAARTLDVFPLLQLDRAHYVAAAQLRRTCAVAGVSASTADCQIATAAMEHGVPLFTLDRDFEAIALHAPLRVLPVPRLPGARGSR